MIVDSLLFRGLFTTWKIRVSPEGFRTVGKTKESVVEESFFRMWTPDGKSHYLFYQPRIILFIQEPKQPDTRVIIPISALYLIKDMMQASYHRLGTDRLYTKNDGVLYCDEKIAKSLQLSMKLPKENTVYSIPTIITNPYTGEESRGIKLISTQAGGKPCHITEDEIRTIYEILDRLDVNTYTTILSMMEKLVTMDGKLDRILETQNTILHILSKQQTRNPGNPSLEDSYDFLLNDHD